MTRPVLSSLGRFTIALWLTLITVSCTDSTREESPGLVPVSEEKVPASAPGTEGKLAFDVNRNVVVFVSDSPFQTWEWNGDRWIRVHTPHQLPKLQWFEISFCPALGTIVLMGWELDDSSQSGEIPLWSYDGSDWELLPATAHYPTIPGGTLLPIPGSGTGSLLYCNGGDGWSGLSSTLVDLFTVWSFDGVDWQSLPLDVTPPYIFQDSSLGFDEERGRLVLSGMLNYGCSTEFLPQIWEFDGRQWTLVNPSESMLGTIVYDRQHYRLLLVNGYGSEYSQDWTKTYLYSEGTWTLIDSAEGFFVGESLAWNPMEEKIFAFRAAVTTTFDDETGWTRRSIATAPTNTDTARAAFFPLLNRVVIVSRNDFFDGRLETWTWDGSSFELLEAVLPLSNYLFLFDESTLVSDESHGRLLLFIAEQFDDRLITWVFDGTAWTRIIPSGEGTVKLRSLKGDYFPPGGEIIVYGNKTYPDQRTDTWMFKDESWTRLELENYPTRRYDEGFVYDPASSRIVLFGGYSEFCLNDIWTFDGSSWELQEAMTKPLFRYSAIMVFDERIEKVILAGGGCGDTVEDDLWEWSAGVWNRVEYSGPRIDRMNAAYAYDSTRDTLVMFGGRNADGLVGSLVELHYQEAATP
jgi:hypothetical protein